MSRQPNLTIFNAWKKYLETVAEGSKLRAEGSKLYAEGDKLFAKGSKLYAEGDKLRAESDKLFAEGSKLYAEGNKLCAEGRIALMQVVCEELGLKTPINWITYWTSVEIDGVLYNEDTKIPEPTCEGKVVEIDGVLYELREKK